MSALRMAATLALSISLSLSSCTGSDRAGSTSSIDSTIAASEAMMLAFRDSVKGVSEAEKAGREHAALAIHAPDSLDACAVPPPAQQVTWHSTDGFALQLPGDFRMTRDADEYRKKRNLPGVAYEWTASDGSRVQIVGVRRDEVHIGWTGLLSSECDMDVSSGRLHVDVANNTITTEDRIIHAHFYPRSQPALSFVGHARSRQRQAELLSAVHTLRLKDAWGTF